MKNILLILLMLSATRLFAQNQFFPDRTTIQVDFDNDFSANADSAIDVNKDLTIRIANGNHLPGKSIRIRCAVLGIDSVYSLASTRNIRLPTCEFTCGKSPLVIYLNAGALVGGGYVYSDTVTIRANGNVKSSQPSTRLDKESATSTNPVSFVSPPFLKPEDISHFHEDSPANGCIKDIVIYYPCCNLHVVLTNKGGKFVRTKFLEYHPDFYDNHGIVLLVANYNPFKYTVNVSNTFVNNFTTVPAALNSLLPYAAASNGPASSSLVDSANANAEGKPNYGPYVKSLLYQVLQLNNQLKALVNFGCIDCNGQTKSDCTDFEGEKKKLKQLIVDNFKPDGDILLSYSNLKTAYMQSLGISSDSFNVKFEKEYLVTQTPDTLVSVTQNMVNTILTTPSYAQFDIPQLQNADYLTFTITLQPATGTTGSLNVNSGALSVPIHGGWKIDWSTGVYYSSVKNDNYALQPQASAGDSLRVVKENSFKGGTAGIVALLHAYPRLGTNLNAGFVLGFGKSTDLNYSVLAGLAAMLGKDNRVSIGFGLNFSNVKSLSASQSTVPNLNLPPSATINTYNRFKTGIFLTFTYAFSVSQSAQTASTTNAAASPSGGGNGSGPAAAATPAASSPGTGKQTGGSH